ncbi:MAG: heterodisulfide reductase-related iron-sulfur binding cluster, partial [Promethearchaeota archaeon]
RIVKSDLKRSTIPKKYIQTNSCQEMNFMPGSERLVCFDEMELGYTEEQAKKEANRCLNCNCCSNSDQLPEDFEKALDDSGIMIANYGNQDNWSSLNALDYLEIPKSVISLLNQNDIIPVVLPEEKCCGHDALWRGDTETFKTLAEYNVKLFKDVGVKTLIFNCAEGYYTWKHDYKNLFKGKGEFDFEILHISEYILKEKLLEDVSFPSLDKIKVTYHDPCRLGRMSKVFDAPRQVLEQIPSVELIEMEYSKEDAECCGVSSYISCDQNSKKLQEKKIMQAIETSAEYLITACPKCTAHLNCYLNENRELKDKITVIDLVSFLGKLLFLI